MLVGLRNWSFGQVGRRARDKGIYLDLSWAGASLHLQSYFDHRKLGFKVDGCLTWTYHCSQGTSSSPIYTWNHDFFGRFSENVTIIFD